jgi:iron complex transport system ATP-binding protein
MTLRARALTLSLDERQLLSDVDLDCKPGEVLGLVGPNGAGKSTLLKLLAGLVPPSAGTIALGDTPLSALSANARARAIAYLPQEGEIAWPIGVEALVALGRLPHSDNNADELVRRALGRIDGLHLRSRRADKLSAGERARVLLARAFAVEAPVLLADEPAAALDPFHQLQVMAALKAEAGMGRAVLVVLHDLTLAARFCDRLALLDKGKLIAADAPALVLTEERLDKVFGISAHAGTHEGEIFVLPWRPVTRDRDQA